ncbi:MAG: hypothetical protein JST68_12420 [Bacteroidetes bacterium]|nr:hypothetical protein [Bacteroidota bacterium]
MVKQLCLFLSMVFAGLMASAGEWHVNSFTGNDANPGTKAMPLKTLREAAFRVNFSSMKGGDTILLSDGVHLLTETVLFNNNRFSQEGRLTIRAEVMPDEPGWSPQRMPIIVTVVPVKANGDGEEARGLEIEVSHVTMEGLRFSGSPDYYYIDGRQNRRSYPIWRNGKNLEDLVVTQCMFVGNIDVMPLRVAIIANGNGVVVDHCVFYNCENPVVFGDEEGGVSRHNAMRYCVVYGPHYSGVWTTKGTAADFEYHHNVIAGCRAAWIADNTQTKYKVHDCVFAGNVLLTANGRGAAISSDFLQMENVKKDGVVEIEKNQGKKNYLQVKEGGLGAELGAGLFKK